MPELPEVQTTVNGLSKTIVGKTITDIWSDFHIGTTHGHKQNIKNKKYLADFKKRSIGAKVINVERKGKNILINLHNNETIIVHMKMTGHLMYSGYNTSDPYNGYIHFKLVFSDGTEMVLSDLRKFASVCIEKSDELKNHEGLSVLGPDPLRMGREEFIKKVISKNGPVKSILMDQGVIAGIGNIYSDEILWASKVHPLSNAANIPEKIGRIMFSNTQRILKKSIELGGDSMSDYRNAFGEKGGFQNCHKAYRQTGKKCAHLYCRNKKNAIITRMVVKGRSSHFCPIHQKLYT